MGDENKKLKQVGLKATLPRLKVLEVISASESRHLSAEEIYRRLLEQGNDLGLATVYRVVAQLRAVGILSRNVFESGKAVFELNEGRHHDHLICLACGRVDEFCDAVIEARQRIIAESRGYDFAQRRLALYGYCPQCKSVSVRPE